MRFITVFGILAVAIVATEGSVLSRFYMSMVATTKAPATTKATTTTARPTTTTARPTTTMSTTTTARTTTTVPTTTTQAAPQSAPITGDTAGPPPPVITGETAGPPKEGELPPGAIDQVLALFDMFTQLQGMEDQVFNSIPNNGPDPLWATLGSFPKEVQEIADCLSIVIRAHVPGTPWDLQNEMTCAISVPVATV